MHPAEFRLLIHHHDVAYTGGSGEIRLSAGIAQWVSALADYFKEIGLLLPESSQPLPKQDTAISKNNVQLISLGPPGHYTDHFQRLHHVRQICRNAAKAFDGLLVRGLTPRQHTVWTNIPLVKKAFYLVRSPVQNRLTALSPQQMLAAAINKYRELEYRRIASNGAVLLANSPLSLLEIRRLSGKEAIFVPTSTIRLAEFSPCVVRPVSKPVQLLFCGRVSFLKGVRELLQAVAILKNNGRDCHLDLVGSYDHAEHRTLLRLSRALGIEAQISWHGRVPYGEQLFRFYRSADLFILPSYTEGFPRVLWEAAAHCCPLVTTSIGGIPNLLKPTEHALLVPPRSAEALAAAISQVLADEELRRKMIYQAYHLALDFTVEASAGKLADTLSDQWE